MVFGTAKFKCNNCGKRFISTAMEWNASKFLMPMPCPKCGSLHTYPFGINNFWGVTGPGLYKKIWEINDKQD